MHRASSDLLDWLHHGRRAHICHIELCQSQEPKIGVLERNWGQGVGLVRLRVDSQDDTDSEDLQRPMLLGGRSAKSSYIRTVEPNLQPESESGCHRLGKRLPFPLILV